MAARSRCSGRYATTGVEGGPSKSQGIRTLETAFVADATVQSEPSPAQGRGRSNPRPAGRGRSNGERGSGCSPLPTILSSYRVLNSAEMVVPSARWTFTL